MKTKGIKNPNPPFYKSKGGHFNIKYLNNSFKAIDDIELKTNNDRYISVDLGVCNLATIYDNKGYSFIISGKTYQNKGRVKRGLYKDKNKIYNADSVGAYNIMRLYKLRNNKEITMVLTGLSNPNKISICVTSNN